MKETPEETEALGRRADGDGTDEGELVPEDDRVIGRAFRWSLVVIAGLVVLVGLGVYLVSRPKEKRPEKAMVSAGPEAVTKSASPPTVRFTDITARAGVRFTHTNGAYGDKLLPETMGGGVAFLDYDNDGHPDLLFINSCYWPHAKPQGPVPTMALYRNDGKGGFQDVTRQARLDACFYGMGAAVADYDGDGWADVFFTALGGNRLFRNRGGVFEEVTKKVGVGGGSDEWSTGAAFLDYDGDGDLDLFVVHYVRWSREIDFKLDYRLTGVGRAYGPPQNYQGSHPFLYRNNGDGTFTDVSAPSGIQVKNPATGFPVGKGMALAPVDVDRDGWIDVLVANDTVRKFFFHNRGDGTFEEVGEAYGLAYGPDGNATGAMGVDAAHFRNDREIAFAIGNFANEMTSFYVSQGDPGFFVDDAIGEGIGAPSRRALKFGLFFFDYDLDGRLDLLQANGHIETEIQKVDPSQTYRQAAQLFWNTGRGFTLVNTDATGDLAREIVGRGAAYADVDGDGDLDVALAQTGGPALLLRNDQATGHHWLRVKLTGRPPNRDAIGAWVELTSGGVTQRRQVMPTRSYLSQVELPITFGLGTQAGPVSLKVTWPDRSEQTMENAAADRAVMVEQGK